MAIEDYLNVAEPTDQVIETDAVIADRNRMMLDAPCENDAHRAGIAARKRMLQGICYQFTNDHCNTARSLLRQ